MERSHVTIRAAASEVSEQEGIQSVMKPNRASERFSSFFMHLINIHLDMLFRKKMDIDLQKAHSKRLQSLERKIPIETASFDKFFRDFIGPGICCWYCRLALQGRKNIFEKVSFLGA